MSERLRVSVVVPTCNGAATLPALLDVIAGQVIDADVDVVAIDSGSDDDSVAILRDRVDHLLEIPRAEFDHGATRNRAIEVARGELVALVVQDALPASPTWLHELTAPLVADPTLAATWSRQQPRADASALTRYALAGSIGTTAEARVRRLADPAALGRLNPLDRLLFCAFDDVASCVRRSVWQRHPFPATPIAEDLEWSRTILESGHGVAYVPAALVTHSHERPAAYEFRRTYWLHRRLRELFGLRLVPTAPHLALAVATCSVRYARIAWSDRGRSGVLARALALAVAWPLGQYLGARAAVGGWPQLRRNGV